MHHKNTIFSVGQLGKALLVILCMQPLYCYATQIAEVYQDLAHSSRRTDALFKPIHYNRKSMETFFSTVFNSRSYAEQFLPFTFTHLHQLLQFASLSGKPCDYSKSIIDIFSQKVETATFINAHAAADLIERLPHLLGNQCSNGAEKAKKNVKECLYNFIISDFNSLKLDPEKALDDLATKIHMLYQGTNEEFDTPVKELQQTTLVFLILIMDRIIWSTEDQFGVWNSVKNIADQLGYLVPNQIISDYTQLNKLYWILLGRFVYFLSMAENLELDCLIAIQKDLEDQEKQMPLWTLEESESFMTTKKSYLQQAILSALIRNKAYKAGFITDRIAPLY